MVVFSVAAVEMVLRLHSVIYAPLYALFLVGPPALFIEMWWNSRQITQSGSGPTSIPTANLLGRSV
jgi:hypothetical protein